ncbi:pentapeptide repeat-containing protein [Escherichia fergusonii]|uniref:pentapeptide repeat-containing protein n=1 Tax=Escherichia fergusonii TaxID=564 RepID=UPI00209AB9AC|nr:pentapeptide repeat-containing protein [Escherichia fergusonii]MCO7985179.1 pentapeptide repeat-containing protein [Escherichia fergusonii]
MSASINTSYFNQGNAAVFFGNEVIEPFTKCDNILDSLLRFVTFGKCNYRKLRENFNQAIYLDYRHGPDNSLIKKFNSHESNLPLRFGFDKFAITLEHKKDCIEMHVIPYSSRLSYQVIKLPGDFKVSTDCALRFILKHFECGRKRTTNKLFKPLCEIPSGTNFSGKDLSFLDLSHRLLSQLTCEQTKFLHSSLHNSTIIDCNMNQAHFYLANLEKAKIINSTFWYAHLTEPGIESANVHLDAKENSSDEKQQTSIKKIKIQGNPYTFYSAQFSQKQVDTMIEENDSYAEHSKWIYVDGVAQSNIAELLLNGSQSDCWDNYRNNITSQ